jgi:hypothetical protein
MTVRWKYKIAVKTDGLKMTQRKIAAAENLVAEGITDHVYDGAVAKVTVKTGELWHSIRRWVNGGKFRIFATADHAPFEEFGTRQRKKPLNPFFKPFVQTIPFEKLLKQAKAKLGLK